MSPKVKGEIAIQVADFIKNNSEFALATTERMATNELEDTDSLGILLNKPPRKTHKILWIFPTRERRVFLGTIWFDNDARRATPKNWYFEFSGSEFIGLAKQIADELKSKFQVKIRLSIETGYTQYEMFPGDFYDLYY